MVHRYSAEQSHSTVTVSPDSAVNIPGASRLHDYTIVFKGGKDLPRGDLLCSDPFLEVYLGDPDDIQTLSFVTGVQWSTLCPTWNATWTLLGVPEGSMLLIFVKDKNKMMMDTHLGTCSLVLGSKLEGVMEHTLKVQKPNERTTTVRSVGASATLIKPTTRGPARYSRHTSYAAGVLTRDKALEFFTYRVRLYHLLEAFGTDPSQYQHWNQDYDAAKRIFADNLEGANIRNALHSQHSYLYRHGHNTHYDALATAEDFGLLLHGERLKKGHQQDLRTVVFTYSIVPKGLYFSETGAAFFQDFMSKHAMHANRADEVMFAGEFRVFQDMENNNAWTLLIDNNSGTYGPRKEDLHRVKTCFELNFPDLVVKAVDREDPYLTSLVEATKLAEAAQAAEHKQGLTLFSSMNSKGEHDVLQAHNHPGHACEV
ncbi:hypothetical protein EMPS_01779 [Entomortierella parvispora]|uniref:C2 domain-containing protein n=1 Tax=Entomortierella parvispora TaxID=205924 RepID=A0A9P3H476_9FUNG|nr:hypothetical protein EMPS_01779 [Entomortierella parvispora]